MTPRDLRLLFYFAEIVRAGSIRAAARSLGVTAPVVSEALRDLEALLGVTLIRRTTRRLDLTEAGRVVHGEAAAMCAAGAAAMQVQAPRSDMAGVVHVTTAIELSVSWLPPLLSRFRAAYPGVRVLVDGDDRPAKLGIGSVDLALRAYHDLGAQTAPTPARKPLAVLPVELVCAVDIAPTGGDLAARLQQTGYISAFAEDRQTVTAFDRDGQQVTVPVVPALRVDNRIASHAMALHGLGAALLLRTTVDADLASERLVRVAPGYGFGSVAVVPVLADPMPPAPVRALVAFLHDQFTDGTDLVD